LAEPVWSQPPAYKMNRSISSVRDLWREWSDGIGGGPPVKALEETWGSKWRKETTERRFFNRRRIIIDEIGRIMKDEAKTAEEAVSMLDGRIRAPKKSLDWLQKQIRSSTSD
jgi:hypothetical protein